MKYFSTRGGTSITFEEAVMTGLAPNGGLFIPETIPSLPNDWRTSWKSYGFIELATAIMSLFISPTEISTSELRIMAEKSYRSFRHPDITPVRQLSEKRYVLELFHGPTFAFKDVALQFLGNLFEFFLERRNTRKSEGETRERLTIVGATSGDTGSAAIYGLRNKQDISIFILHPKGKVSPIQEAQMTTVTDANVFNVAVKGTFDDCQDIVKALFGDKTFNEKHKLGAINSINWARILAQTVYYFLAYFQVASKLPSGVLIEDVELQFVVPTGNFGDILAGYYAKRMGLPMAKLVVATNENDILARFWKTGRYEKFDPTSAPTTTLSVAPVEGSTDGRQASSGVKETLSPAMDILVSSNFERLLWYVAYGSSDDASHEVRQTNAWETVASWMNKVKEDGKVEIPVSAFQLARKDFVAERMSDLQTLETIRKYFSAPYSYVVDPHTAVGLGVADSIIQDSSRDVTQIVLSTAHPAKFSEAVTKALRGEDRFDFEKDILPEQFRGLLEKEKRVIDIDRPDIAIVKEVIDSRISVHQSAPWVSV